MCGVEVISTRHFFGLVIIHHSNTRRTIASTSLAPVASPLDVPLNRMPFTTLLFHSFGLHTPR